MKFRIHHSKPTLSKRDADSLQSILESCQIACGSVVRRFEKLFSNYIAASDAVATNSGTSALHLSLLALKIQPGDEIILPSYVCTSVLDSINYVRAKPVVVDVDYDTLNIDIKDTRKKLTRKTKAIIIPHMFGLPCEIDEFLNLGLPIIEDCAQSLGAEYKNKKVGSFGVLSIFSFYATKMITTGYGGMVVSHSKKILDKIRDLSEPDKNKDYRVRYNYKMSDLQAALGIGQFNQLTYFIKRRREIAKTYSQSLASYGLDLPREKNDRLHVFYRYILKTNKAALLNKYLEKNKIETMPPVYRPIHRYLSMDRKKFPNTEKVYNEAVSLSIYPALKKNELSKIIRVVQQALINHQ